MTKYSKKSVDLPRNALNLSTCMITISNSLETIQLESLGNRNSLNLLHLVSDIVIFASHELEVA